MFLSSLAHRRRSHEWMDDPAADPEQLRKSLRFIQIVNRLFRYTRATISHLDQFARNWPRGTPIRILDVATGSADVPLAILKWAEKRGHDVRFVGIDLHARTVAAAKAAVSEAKVSPEKLSIIQADAMSLPFADGAFDYAMTNMFLHHLDEEQVIQV